MNLDLITPYNMQKNLEALQKEYDELLEKVGNLKKLVDELEGKLNEEK